MGKHLSEKHKGIILKMSLEGKKPLTISRKIRKPVNTVYDFLNKVKTTNTFARNNGSGKKPLLEKGNIVKLQKECKKNGKRSAKDIFLESALDLKYIPSSRTLQRALNSKKLASRVCAKKPLLTKVHKANRLKLAQKFKVHGEDYGHLSSFQMNRLFVVMEVQVTSVFGENVGRDSRKKCNHHLKVRRWWGNGLGIYYN